MQARYETRHQAGEDIAAHRHEHAYAALVLRGRYEEAGPDGVWKCAEGDLILHPPFHMHLNRFAFGDAAVLNFTLPHAAARRFSAHGYCLMRVRDPARVARCTAVDEALAEALDGCEPKAPAQPRDWLDALAEALCAQTRPRIGALARAAGKTPEHAARAFRARFGMAPAAFRAEQQVRRALTQLSGAARPLAAIAAESGFADQAHLSRRLRGATRRTPAELRRLLA